MYLARLTDPELLRFARAQSALTDLEKILTDRLEDLIGCAAICNVLEDHAFNLSSAEIFEQELDALGNELEAARAKIEEFTDGLTVVRDKIDELTND